MRVWRVKCKENDEKGSKHIFSAIALDGNEKYVKGEGQERQKMNMVRRNEGKRKIKTIEVVLKKKNWKE